MKYLLPHEEKANRKSPAPERSAKMFASHHGNPAEIELVATDPNDPEQGWHVKEFGAVS